jgi:hypothetical protein
LVAARRFESVSDREGKARKEADHSNGLSQMEGNFFFSRIHHGEVYQSYRRGAKRQKGAANKRWQVLTLSLLS